MKFLPYIVGLIVTYLVAWTGSYILFWVLRGDTIDFAYYFDALFAAWTLGGIEGAAPFMLIVSFILFIPLAVILVLVLKRRHAHGQH